MLLGSIGLASNLLWLLPAFVIGLMTIYIGQRQASTITKVLFDAVIVLTIVLLLSLCWLYPPPMGSIKFNEIQAMEQSYD